MYYSGILNALRVSQPTLGRTALEANRLNWSSASSEAVKCLTKATGNLTMLMHELAPVHYGAPTRYLAKTLLFGTTAAVMRSFLYAEGCGIPSM